MPKKLPIGIQTFSEIREDNYYYVDKTSFALQLIDQGKHYFLSRPRRFGKSLLIDTLKELFEGNANLFEGLYAEHHWDWNIKYPVLRFSFGAGVLTQAHELEQVLGRQLDTFEEQFGIPTRYPDYLPNRLSALISSLHQTTGQRVVILVDEYDKPILDNLTQPEIAVQMREQLRSLYSVFKDADAHLKFLMITGVSKFSKVSLFSGLNNLRDITLEQQYSALCGYTHHDLCSEFAPETEGVDLEKVREWYNGYNWRGESVYNPFDVLLYFAQRDFRPFWFETGTPTFLANLLSQKQWFTPDFMQHDVNEAMLSSFDVEHMLPEALLWQTGYLTFAHVKEITTGHRVYTLSYPNREVEAALNDVLLPVYGPERQPALVARSHMLEALLTQDFVGLKASIERLFASIPHDWYRKAAAVGESSSLTDGEVLPYGYSTANKLANFEGHYASVFYSQLAALGLNTQPEDVTHKGRIDLSLRLKHCVYLFEFKVIDGPPDGSALQQLIERDYAAKYREPGVEIVLVGIEFDRNARNVVGFETRVELA